MTRRILGAVLVLASLAAVAQSARTTATQSRFVQCQVRVNDGLITRSRVLTDAAEQERAAERAADDAQRALFTDPATLKPVNGRTAAERARLVELFRRYQAALTRQNAERAEADKARAEHPVPPPPSEVCG